jgi:DNA-directed RNA polymerase specialized sigma24 family protein
MKIFDSLKTRWIAWVWNHTPNCAEMSRLASRSLEQPLSMRTWLKMRLHYLICAWCKRYFTQLRFLHEAAPHFDEHAGTLPARSLSVEARRRLMQRLQGVESKSS